MVAVVPSLEGSLYLKDPQSIIAYTLRKFFRTPKDTIPFLDTMIISLPWLVARFGNDPENLCNNIQSDLQNCFDRIFANDRKITVNASYETDSTDTYFISISVIYVAKSGEIDQVGVSKIGLKNGRLTIPEDSLDKYFLS